MSGVQENTQNGFEFEFGEEGEATNKMSYANIKFSDLDLNPSPSPIKAGMPSQE